MHQYTFERTSVPVQKAYSRVPPFLKCKERAFQSFECECGDKTSIKTVCGPNPCGIEIA
eukprot:Gb_14302 [translate_table: standard]